MFLLLPLLLSPELTFDASTARSSWRTVSVGRTLLSKPLVRFLLSLLVPSLPLSLLSSSVVFGLLSLPLPLCLFDCCWFLKFWWEGLLNKALMTPSIKPSRWLELPTSDGWWSKQNCAQYCSECLITEASFG